MLALITYPNSSDVWQFARELVERRLAAGISILPGARSVYWWQDNLCEASEQVVLAHVSATAFARFRSAVEELHPYDTPCIVAFEPACGSEDFLNWIEKYSCLD